MTTDNIVWLNPFSQVGLEKAGGGKKNASLIFIFLKPLVQQHAGEASPNSMDLKVRPILLQFGVVRVHSEKLSNKNKHQIKTILNSQFRNNWLP